MLFEQLALAPLGIGLILLGHFNYMKGNAVKIRMAFRVGMVADDERDFARQFARVPAVEQVHQAMIVLGNEYRDTQAVARKRDLPLHVQTVRDWSEVAREILHLNLEAGEVPLDAREIKAQFRDHVLLEMENIPAGAEDEFRERCVQAFAVRALHAQDGAWFHNFSMM